MYRLTLYEIIYIVINRYVDSWYREFHKIRFICKGDVYNKYICLNFYYKDFDPLKWYNKQLILSKGIQSKICALAHKSKLGFSYTILYNVHSKFSIFVYHYKEF